MFLFFWGAEGCFSDVGGTMYDQNPLKTPKEIKKYLFCNTVPPGGNFDIDAGDGGGGKTFRTPNILQNPKSSYENCSHFWDIFRKCRKISLNIFPYTEKYNESDKRIKNNKI